MEEKFSIPTVAFIVEREDTETPETQILIQKRFKPESDPKYTGVYELPAGKIREFEDIRESARRELKEETGLELETLEIAHTETLDHQGDKSFAFVPFCCEQMLKGPYPYIGFVFLVKAKGEVKETREAKEAKWVNTNEIRELIKRGEFHPYHIGAIRMYLNRKAKSNPGD